MTIAGDLRDRITFQARGAIDDGYGNVVSGPWGNQFTVAASIRPAPGREEILAQRLAGVRPIEITIRWSPQTLAIKPDWRCVDARIPENAYNIHDIRDPTGRRIWQVLTCSLGTAT